MTDLFLDYEPKKALDYFYEISQIPRGSGKEEAISDYLFQFAKSRKLYVYQDEYKNILIRKNATAGYEDAPTVILQGHMDMVWEKNKDTEHDFLTEGIKLILKDDHIYAENTTLGADNGIAVALILALLDSDDIFHPRLEALFTVEEETGLTGAMNFDTSNLTGKYLINLDSENDSEILVSCAGGVRIHHELNLNWIERPSNTVCYKISVSGLKGGHSGMDINLNRANANKLLARTLYALQNQMKVHIAEISGGAKDNAIPREAEALILIDKSEEGKLKSSVEELETLFHQEYSLTDENIRISAVYVENCQKCFTEELSEKVVNMLMTLPNGVQTMTPEMDSLVESSINLAVIDMDEDKLSVTSSARSSVDSRKDYLVNVCEAIAKSFKVKMTTNSSYPGWSIKQKSKLRDEAVKSYLRLFGTEPEIVATHAGVECGIFKNKMPDLDMISIGPNIYDVHTPNEHVSISSVEKMWQWLIEILRTIE